MPLERSARLGALVRHLPFDVDDFDAASDAFLAWHHGRAEADRRTVQLWAYCYVVWYFYGKFARERTSGPSDLDAAIERATRRVFRSMEEVRDPERFPQFVSVLCRNVLLTHRERRRDTVEVDDGTAPVPPDAADAYDRVLVRRIIERAVDALPPAIGEVARMRLLERRSYADIAEATGRPVASTRTYYSKAIAKLRDDPALQALRDGFAFPDDDDSEGGSGGEVSVEAPAEVRSGDPPGLRP